MNNLFKNPLTKVMNIHNKQGLKKDISCNVGHSQRRPFVNVELVISRHILTRTAISSISFRTIQSILNSFSITPLTFHN